MREARERDPSTIVGGVSCLGRTTAEFKGEKGERHIATRQNKKGGTAACNMNEGGRSRSTVSCGPPFIYLFCLPFFPFFFFLPSLVLRGEEWRWQRRGGKRNKEERFAVHPQNCNSTFENTTT